ncbi:MAG: metal ABC transporter substrate-binding protein [Lachnospiraceae bacterium]|nr:metal ABC transporter substrate-binding protein [Lachnospiraceae bacterium]
MKIMILKNRTDSENTRPLGRVCAITGLSLLLAVTAGCGKQGGDPVASTTLPAADQPAAQQTQDQPSDTKPAVEWNGDAETVPEGALTVVACPGAHEEILKMAQTALASEGIQLYVNADYDDYMMPNLLVDADIYECNYFQHEEYLKTFNEEQGTDLVSVGKIHFEPLGIYRGRKHSLSELSNGDIITVPRDTANQARALKLLADCGLLSLDPAKEDAASIEDIRDNPKGITISLMDASQVPAAIAESAFVVMNGNYARQALYTLDQDALAYEAPDSAAASRYANIIAVKRENAEDPRVKKLVEVLQGSDLQTYMQTKYAGAVVPYAGS